jgi:predicted AlkP superfamily phosphohydrolase/phosphomutase
MTLLIGLDGATFTILDGLMRDGIMPFLRDFARSGVRADLRTVIPALTPPAWTSLMTGRSPGQHGIFDFFRKDSPRSPRIRLLSSRDVNCETVWSMANRAGKRATVLNFPSTFPPPPIDGYLISGWMPWRQLRLGCNPPALYDRLRALPGFDSREMAMDLALEEKAIEGCHADEYEDWIDLHIRRERQWSRILRELMRDDPCPLTAVLFDGVDKIQHLFWRFIDPACLAPEPASWEMKIRRRCLDYYRELDGIIADLVARAGPEASAVIASDHGFGPQRSTFFVNTWLAQHGYLAWSDEARDGSEASLLGLAQISRHVYTIDWSRTKAYVATPSSNGIHIVVADEAEGGVPIHEYETFRRRLAEELREVTDPETGEALITEIWTREQVFDGPSVDLAPDLTLVLKDGGLVSILASDAPVKPRRPPTGTHRPDGIFMASGPLFRDGISLPGLSILDVAPTLLFCLGLQIPADLEGRVPSEALTQEALRAHAAQGAELPRLSAFRATPDWNGLEAGLDPQDEQEITNRLQALGYLE